MKSLKDIALALDNDESAIEFAEKSSIISRGYINSKIPLEDSDIIIICLYPNQIVKYIKDNMNFFKKGAIITDIASIRRKEIL